ncbi:MULTISPECIES: c-type cytochrome [unclassified Pseudomonas]|jgi:cytochrome c5|uniref:c-type cytochrome n=1 Tax=unclassified Pseudomonas TaxID=196821 RepID=UPI002A36D782|nr:MULTISPECIES: c-type cytochrome [unclassified Pseudomonas]MDX9669349.1 c-type cytochrome [Pseudomonas sp. P8_250]WPN36610.1 c-type cytochrome [Pseudomonas sp. P8_139]WPN41589.1 c-type cytochrome [Pseudomonas sp. P8_229]
MRAIRLSLLLALAMVLPGCGEEPKPPATHNTAIPQDPALAQIYTNSCQLCHANPAANAPLTGDRKAWEPRIQQGVDTLLDHAINGYNGMPPMGQCVECSEEQFLQLIGFMADQPLPQ